MDPNISVGIRNVVRGSKKKTGCATCRIRKIKCDESKPFCRKCVSTGRTCEGYELAFRHYIVQSRKDGPSQVVESGNRSQLMQLTLSEIAPQDIDLLNRHFTTKTIFGTELGCQEDARRILYANLPDSPIQHAVLSLRAFRRAYEICDQSLSSLMRDTTGYNYGLQRYNAAISGLTSNLLSKSPDRPQLALLCCQLFISIEQVRGNYDAMAQHIIRGFRIMHEYQARPMLGSVGLMVPAQQHQLPLVDVFIIKLFVAPCKFAQPATRFGESSLVRQPLRTVTHDVQTELKKIGFNTLEFLSLLSNVSSEEAALRLKPLKETLLESLQSWLIDLGVVQTKDRWPRADFVTLSLMRLFHSILKVVLLGSLDSSADLDTYIQAENDRLQSIADKVTGILKAKKMQPAATI